MAIVRGCARAGEGQDVRGLSAWGGECQRVCEEGGTYQSPSSTLTPLRFVAIGHMGACREAVQGSGADAGGTEGRPSVRLRSKQAAGAARGGAIVLEVERSRGAGAIESTVGLMSTQSRRKRLRRKE
jgi:hypothetical protein